MPLDDREIEKRAKVAVTEGLASDIASYIAGKKISSELSNAIPIALVTLAGRILGSVCQGEEHLMKLIDEFSRLLDVSTTLAYRERQTSD